MWIFAKNSPLPRQLSKYTEFYKYINVIAYLITTSLFNEVSLIINIHLV